MRIRERRTLDPHLSNGALSTSLAAHSIPPASTKAHLGPRPGTTSLAPANQRTPEYVFAIVARTERLLAGLRLRRHARKGEAVRGRAGDCGLGSHLAVGLRKTLPRALLRRAGVADSAVAGRTGDPPASRRR